MVWNLEGGYGPKQCSVAARMVVEGLLSTEPREWLDLLGLAPTDGQWCYTHRGASLRRPAANVRADIDRARKIQLMAIAGKRATAATATEEAGPDAESAESGGTGDLDGVQTCAVQ